MNLKFSLKDLLLFTALIAVACAALVNAGIWWHSIVVTTTLTAMTVLVIRGMLTSGPRRAFAAGWLLMAAAYLALVFGPWTGNQLGPNLITSKGLAQLEYTTRGNNPSPPVLEYNSSPQLDFGSDLSLIYSGSTIVSGNVYMQPRIWTSTGYPTGNGVYTVYDNSATLSYSTFQSTGQWLFASILGFAGGHLAAFLARCRCSRAKT